ncbi:hypothetical protein BKA56DRAFT_24706 [Ilyonectria sp. MPI-CAGE-AT-0026]|nr:hypothetical protein BKA56DRAFT_24706 [Ilyonectria sp. MPI-CAGE-AT-0026]
MRRALRRPTTLPAASLLKTRPLKPQRLISTSTLLIKKNLFLCRGNFSLPFSSCPLHLVISPVPRFHSSCFLRHRPPLVPLPGVVIQPLRLIQSQKETEPVQPPTAPPSEFEIRFGGQGTNLNKSSLLPPFTPTVVLVPATPAQDRCQKSPLSSLRRIVARLLFAVGPLVFGARIVILAQPRLLRPWLLCFCDLKLITYVSRVPPSPSRHQIPPRKPTLLEPPRTNRNHG